MAGSLGTNYPYGVSDVLNLVGASVGEQLGLQVIPVAGTPYILHSFTTAGSGATGTATGTTRVGNQNFRDLDIYANVTFSQGAATNTLIIYVDGRIDGTNFVNIGAFPAITTAGGHTVHLSKRAVAGGTTTIDVDAGLGTVRAVGWGDALRIRRQITGTATTQFSATIYITNQVG